MVDDADLIGNLAAAHNEHQGTVGIGNGLAHDVQLFLHQQAAVGGQEGGNAHGGGMGPVAGAECVVHKHLGQRRILLCKLHVVLGLALHKPDVFQQEHLSGLERGCHLLCLGANNVIRQGYGNAQKLLEPLLYHLEGILLLIAVLGAALVGAENHGSPLLQQVLNGGERLTDAAVVGNYALVVGGNVEIAAAKHLFALEICIEDGFLFVVHGETSV